MSAIAGIINFTTQDASVDDLERMHQALIPFGPDSGGVWREGIAGLVQRGMHFVPEDLSDMQPIVEPTGQFALVSAGRIDTRPELAARLRLTADDALGIPDSHYILKACQRWTENAVHSLIGDYSFALWNRVERTLLIACSAIGSNPIFYYQNPERLVFSTTLSGLFAAKGVPREINQDYLAHLLTRTSIEPGESLYSGVRQLQPGQILTVANNKVATRTYWEPSFRSLLYLKRDEDYIEAFHEIFSRAVSDNLRSTGEVGLMLSGGFDSSSVAAVAAPQVSAAGKRLRTFTEVSRPTNQDQVFDGRYADESPYIEAIARQYDIDPTYITRADHSLLGGLDSCFEHLGLPIGAAVNRPWIEAIQRKAHEQGVRVMLSGLKGNMSFSFAGIDAVDMLLERHRYTEAWTGCRGNAALFARKLLKTHLPTSITNSLALVEQKLSAGAEPPAIVNEQFAKRCGVANPNFWHMPPKMMRDYNSSEGRVRNISAHAAGWSPMAAALRAMYGVDQRDPTGDLRVVEFCLSLPNEQFNRNGVGRSFIRRAMKGKLPPEILDRNLRGLQAADWRDRIREDRAAVLALLPKINACKAAQEALNLQGFAESLTLILSEAPCPEHFGYRNSIEQWLTIGAFLCWFEGSK